MANSLSVILEQQRVLQERLELLQVARLEESWSDCFQIWTDCLDIERTPAQTNYLLEFGQNVALSKNDISAENRILWLKKGFQLSKEAKDPQSRERCLVALIKTAANNGNWSDCLKYLELKKSGPDDILQKIYCHIRGNSPIEDAVISARELLSVDGISIDHFKKLLIISKSTLIQLSEPVFQFCLDKLKDGKENAKDFVCETLETYPDSTNFMIQVVESNKSILLDDRFAKLCQSSFQKLLNNHKSSKVGRRP